MAREQQFEDYLRSAETHHRLRAVHSLQSLLAHFLEPACSGATRRMKSGSSSSEVCGVLARVIPLCGDVCEDIRLKALMCVQRLLEIQGGGGGGTRAGGDEYGLLTEVADKLTSADVATVYDGIRHLSKVPKLELRNKF